MGQNNHITTSPRVGGRNEECERGSETVKWIIHVIDYYYLLDAYSCQDQTTAVQGFTVVARGPSSGIVLKFIMYTKK